MSVTIVKEYDEATGELISEERKERERITFPDGSLRIHHLSERKFGQEYKKGNKFNFIVDQSIRGLMQKLSLKEIGYLTVLSTYENYDGVLFLTERAKKPMGVSEIRKAINVSRNEIARDIIDKLVNLDALKIIEVEKKGVFYSAYMISDDFFFKGRLKRLHRGQVTKQFTTRMREVYSENGAASTGWLSLLMQYLDDENFLISNINRSPFDEPVAMSQQDIADVTGVSKAMVNHRLRNMMIQGYSVWEATTTKETGTRYRLNPLVANKMPEDTFDTILNNFILKSSDVVK